MLAVFFLDRPDEVAFTGTILMRLDLRSLVASRVLLDGPGIEVICC